MVFSKHKGGCHMLNVVGYTTSICCQRLYREHSSRWRHIYWWHMWIWKWIARYLSSLKFQTLSSKLIQSTTNGIHMLSGRWPDDDIRQKHSILNPCIHFLMVIMFSFIWLAGAYIRTMTTLQDMAPILVNLCLQLTPLQFDIRDSFHCQSIAVKTRHPLTSITWPYRELKCRGCMFF